MASSLHAFVPSEKNQLSEFIYQMPLDGLLFIKHKRFEDDRGFYSELNRIPEIEDVLGITFDVKQLNLSHSNDKVTRGFHAENWNKLLSVVHGSCFCAWADVREDSNTFGQTVTLKVGVNVSHFGSVFVSKGIANSFCACDGEVDYLYAVDQLYAERDTSNDIAISLFDPDLNVAWPLAKKDMIISKRDETATSMKQRFPEKYA